MIFKQDLIDAIQSLAVGISVLEDRMDELNKRIKKLETKAKPSVALKTKKEANRLEKAIKEVTPKRGRGRPRKNK